MSKIYLTGDTHGIMDVAKITPERWKEQKKLTKEDYLIILGDAGIIWTGGERDDVMIKFYEDRPFTTLFIDGNHENHVALAKYPLEDWNGGKIHRLSGSVIHLMRGQYYTIAGRTFWTMGGAHSVDRAYRTEGKSWWPEELPSREELDEGIRTLKEHDMKVDYVLTHECAASIGQVMYGHIWHSEFTDYFDSLEFDHGLQFKRWYFGHHHKDRVLDAKHICLYQQIIDLDTEDFSKLAHLENYNK